MEKNAWSYLMSALVGALVLCLAGGFYLAANLVSEKGRADWYEDLFRQEQETTSILLNAKMEALKRYPECDGVIVIKFDAVGGKKAYVVPKKGGRYE